MTQYSVLSTQNSPVARTPLDRWHFAHGARFVEIAGWRTPAVYSDVESELAAARNGVVVADICASAKFSLLGSGVARVCQALTHDLLATQPRGVRTIQLGGSALACRLSDDHLLVLAGNSNRDAVEARLAELDRVGPLIRRDVTSSLAGFHIFGPRVEDLLRRVTALDVSLGAFELSSCAETQLAGVHAVLVRAPELTVPSMRIYVSWDLAEYVWERLFAAGHELGVTPVGLEAWERLAAAA